MLNLLYTGHSLDQLIVTTSQKIHELIFFTRRFDPDHDLVSLFPLMYKLGDHRNRVLKIRT